MFMKCLTDYLIMLSLPDRIDNQIKLYKKSCAKHIGKFKGLYAQGHISFGIFRDESAKPLQPSHNMAEYLEAISNVFNDIEPRKLYIKDFAFFSHGPRFKTIYAAVIMDNHTKDWFARIDAKLKVNKQTVPHITIAKNIPVEQFDILWPFFKNINYEEAFYCEELTILQKDVTNPDNIYRPYKKIPFGDKKPSRVSNSY
jgi:2'-5' RNA ligase